MNNIKCPILSYFLLNCAIKSSFFKVNISDTYVAKVNYIVTRFASQNTIVDDIRSWVDISDFAIAEIAPQNKKSSWRVYKGALTKSIASAQELCNENSSDIYNILEEAKARVSASTGGKAVEFVSGDITSGSAKKATVISASDIYSLRMHASSVNESFAVDWLEFSILTSIRPNEIEGATILLNDDHGFSISVRNTIKSSASAKHLQDGSLPEFREVPLNSLSFLDIIFVQGFLQSFLYRMETETYDLIYKSSKNALYRISSTAIGKSIALSVGRTQFAANAKSSGVSAEDLAQMMGHTDPTRAARSYGRKASGWSGFKSKKKINDL